MDKPEVPAGGVKVFSIGGRMIDIRERCVGMNDEERRWRAQFLKDQILSPNEPRFVPEFHKDTTNPFRRLWHTPMQKFENFCVEKLGKEGGLGVRHYIGKTCIMFGIMVIVVHYVKHHGNDWTFAHAPEWIRARGRSFSGDPDYPNYREIPLKQYADFGFSSSPLCKKN